MDYTALRDYLPIGAPLVIRTNSIEISGFLQVVTEAALGLRKHDGTLYFVKLCLIDDLTVGVTEANDVRIDNAGDYIGTDTSVSSDLIEVDHMANELVSTSDGYDQPVLTPQNYIDDIVDLVPALPSAVPQSIDGRSDQPARETANYGVNATTQIDPVPDALPGRDLPQTARQETASKLDPSLESADNKLRPTDDFTLKTLVIAEVNRNPPELLDPKPLQLDAAVRTERQTEIVSTIANADIGPAPWEQLDNPTLDTELQSIRSIYQYAVTTGETGPDSDGIQTVLARLYKLSLGRPRNFILLHLLGYMELMRKDPDRARFLLVRVADAGGSASAWRLILIASALLNDSASIIYSGYRLAHLSGLTGFNGIAQDWMLFLLNNQRGGIIRTLLDAGKISVEDVPEHFRSLLDGIPAAVPERPAGLLSLAAGLPSRPQPGVKPTVKAEIDEPRRPSASAAVQHSQQGIAAPLPDDPYARAHAIEHRGGDLEEAKRLYRLAIATGRKRESRIKDLAWLVRRTEGPTAALKVIEIEYPRILRPSDSLDNILIDFLYGAERYAEALVVINRQLRRNDLSYLRRSVLQHLRATIRLKQGEDSVPDWLALTSNVNDAYARRGLALAYLLRGTPIDLDSAEMSIGEDNDAKAQDIKERITQARGGLPPQSAIDVAKLLDNVVQQLAPPLIDFVTRHYSKQAQNYMEQRLREDRRAHPLDAERLARNADNLRGIQRENSADGYISAAVIVRDKLERIGQDERASDEYRQYLVQGFVALADVMLDREHQDAARDLYATALSVSESMPHADSMADVKYGFARYFVSLDGRRALARVRGSIEDESLDDILLKQLRHCHDAHGNDVFDLVVQLFAFSSYAGRRVDAAINRDSVLAKSAQEFLADRLSRVVEGMDLPSGAGAWIALARAWLGGERSIVGEILTLQNMEMSEESLQSAISVLSRVGAESSFWIAPHLGGLMLVLQEFRRSLYENTFEERETCFRRAQERMSALLAEIELAPTQFAVESLVPVADRITQVAESAMAALLADSAPQPALSPALETVGTDPHGRVTFQVKISNAPGRAPIESPTLSVLADNEVFSCIEPRITLKTAIRGGDKLIEVLKLEVTEKGRSEGAFSVPVVLEYLSRGSGELQKVTATLPVQLSTAEFVEVANPYLEGSLGRPVGRADMFYGRNELLDRIVTRFRAADTGGSGFAIYGQKRAGKSSIRIRLAEALAEVTDVVVVDLGNMGKLAPAPTNSHLFVGSLCWQIVNRANRQLIVRGLVGLWSEPDDPRKALLSSPTPIVDCLDYFGAYRDALPTGCKLRFLLMFDEFQYFDSWIRAGLVDPSLMQGVKAIIESGIFDMVIVGLDALDRLFSKHPNIFAVFARERVTYLEDVPARLLIDEPIRIGGRTGSSRYRESAIDRILELTGGSAFYIQKFCYELVRHMNAYKAFFVTEADVDIVRQELLARLELKDFDNLESSGYVEQDPAYSGVDSIPHDLYHEALLALAIASREVPVRLDRIQSVYTGEGDLQAILSDLVGRDVVRKEAGLYRIVVRLYQDWLLFHHFGLSSSSDEL